MSTSRMCVPAWLFSPCVVAILLLTLPVAQGTKLPAQTYQETEARQALNQGVLAFKNGQNKEAEQYFLRAKQLDPRSINARVYLATAYASEYIPGAPGEENTANGRAATEEFKGVLELDPENISAMDGLGSLLFQLAGQPFSPDLLAESKSYHQRHIQIRPHDPEPYYWIGVIDWTLAFRANGELRERVSRQTKAQTWDAAAPLPPELREQYAREYGPTIEEGINSLKRAISIRPDYDDALAYLNLLYRRKADVVVRQDEREDLLEMADDLVDRLKEIKTQRAQPQP